MTSGGTINVTVTEDGDVHAETLKNSSGTQIVSRTTTISEDTTSIVYGDGCSLIYVYDDNGNIAQIKGKGTASATETVLQSYTYDAFGQLTAENDAENNRSAVFTYDLNGNILSKVETVNGASTTHTYQYGNSQWRDLLTSYDGDAITYDAGGNPLTYRDGITFTWKNGRQLASYEDSTYRITYDYNDSGIRVKKTVTEKSTGTVTVTENYLEDTSVVAQKITTTPSGGTASTEMIWYIYDGTGAVVGVQTEDGTYYYEKNLQGDITSIVNESGAEVVSYSYDAWGNVILEEDTSGVQLVEKNPFTYRGYYRDNETGFYYLQSRYYDSEMGRFLNADTILGTSSPVSKNNLFVYCGNSPVDMSDADGKTPIQAVFAAVGAVAGWYLGDYVAKKLGYRKGWKYWAIRSGVIVGGAVIGWFAGGAMAAIIKGFIFASPKLVGAIPLWVYRFLGITSGSKSVVLGSYPIYLSLAKKLGSNVFCIAKSTWNGMSKGEQWAANKAFLDKAIRNGQKFTLSTNAYKAKKGTYFYKEIQYLLSRGYKITKSGWEIRKK